MVIGKNILVVDDDPQIITLLTHMLKKLRPNDQITTVTSCEDALDRLAKYNYDIIISDYCLSDGNGKIIFTNSNPNSIKVGISGSCHEKDFGTSCNRFLAKPFGLKELQSALNHEVHSKKIFKQ